MKLRNVIAYTATLFFLGWCAYTFKGDVAQIEFAHVWAARDAILLALLLSLLNYLLRVARWTLYLSRLGHLLPFGFSALTYIAGFAFTLSPGKVGEIVRSRYYQKIGIPLSSTTAAFFIERLMDLLSMLALAAFAFSASSSSFDTLILATGIVVLLLLSLFAVTPWMKVSGYVEKAHWLPESFKKIALGILRTLLSAKALLKPPLLMAGFIIGLLAWGAEGTGLMFIGTISPDISMDWSTAVGIYSIAIIVGALSFLPGGLGSTEAVMIALLAAHRYSMSDAILITLVCRLVTLWFAVVIGWMAVAVLRYAPSPGGASQ